MLHNINTALICILTGAIDESATLKTRISSRDWCFRRKQESIEKLLWKTGGDRMIVDNSTI